MAIFHSELDPPEPITGYNCRLCGAPLKLVQWHWVYDRWLHDTVHVRCAEEWEKRKATEGVKAMEREIPERFRHFDAKKANQEALWRAQEFSPESDKKTLAIVGVPGRGKSRLMWAIVEQFFAELGGSRWVEYFLFEDLITEFDRNALTKLKGAKHAFIDNVGGVESYGRERAQLQSVIRTRINKGMWTFLTIDNIDFDSGLKALCRDRALFVVIDQ